MTLPSIISSDELVGRFLTDKDYYSTTGVKYQAFMPPKDLHLSTVRIEGLSLQQIWDLGQTQVIARMKQSRPLYGVAKLKVADVRSQRLDVDPDNTPFYRHASVVGWPEKAMWLSITQQLAAASELVLKK